MIIKINFDLIWRNEQPSSS